MIHSRIAVLSSALLALTLTSCDDGEGQKSADAALDFGRPSLGDLAPPDATIDAAPPAAEAGTPDADPPDAAPSQTLCQGAGQRGLLSEPVSFFDGAAYSPRVHVANDGSYALAWLTPDDAGAWSTLWFGRLNADGSARGVPIELGAARFPQHRLVRDGERFLVAWLNARRPNDAIPFKGVRVRAIDPDDSVIEMADIGGSATSEHLAFDWAEFGGGMLVYTRGRQGQDGVAATPVTSELTYEATRPLTDSPASSPSVAYGNGAWGVAWLARDGEHPSELAFLRVDDLAQAQAPERRYAGQAVGNVHLAYGANIYAVGWTRPDELGMPRSVVSFFDPEGEFLASPALTGPEGFSLVTDITHMPPLGFAVAYEESIGGAERRVGISYGSTTQIVPPSPLPRAEGVAQQGLSVSGNQSRLAVVYSADPAPSNAGHSEAVRLVWAPVGPCR